MKAFLFTTTTEDKWEICQGQYLVIAESEDEAKKNFGNDSHSPWSSHEKIENIKEIDLTVKSIIEIQYAVVE